MECLRAMSISSSSSVVCPVLPSLAIARSGVAATSPARLQVAVSSLRSSPSSLSLRSGPSSKRADFPKWWQTTRASSSSPSSSPADEVDEVASEAERGVEDAKEKSKQSFSDKVEDIKKVVNKAQSHAGETANKELEKLKDITNQLLEQAELARQKLTVTAQETAFKQKDNLAFVVENGPEPVKEVAETALNAHYSKSGKTGSKIHDFCLGLPFGGFLTIGGLLWFIIYGSTSAIRFGVLLGSAILFLSVTSLKKWKLGESSIPFIQGQAAITAFIFLRYYRRYTVTKAFFPTAVTGLISGAMLGFYIYVLVSGGNPPKKPKPQSN